MILYITFQNVFNDDHCGMHKKIIEQCRALENLLSDRVCYTSRVFETAMMLHDGEILTREVAVDRVEYYDVLRHWVKKENVRLLYTRYHFCDRDMLDLYGFFHEAGIKIISEIPTYPYDDELGECLSRTEDRMYRESLAKNIDCFCTYSEDRYIWKRPCINIFNGCTVPSVLPERTKSSNVINLVAVLAMFYWGGMERIIRGLHNYYRDKSDLDPDVYLYLIGDGKERGLYECLTKKYELSDYIIFTGTKMGEDLIPYYTEADVAINTLGSYKKGIEVGCSIKGAEYCAYGLPTLIAYRDTRFHDDFPYIYRASNDSSIIDVKDVVRWYRGIQKHDGYRKEIWDYARKNLTWEGIMKPVAHYFMEDDAR